MEWFNTYSVSASEIVSNTIDSFPDRDGDAYSNIDHDGHNQSLEMDVEDEQKESNSKASSREKKVSTDVNKSESKSNVNQQGQLESPSRRRLHLLPGQTQKQLDEEEAEEQRILLSALVKALRSNYGELAVNPWDIQLEK